MIRVSVSLLIGVVIALSWAIGHPEIISFHEQNQLFLFTSHYFTERIAVAGGLADYVSEFLVQFYYYPTVGACILASVMIIIQWLLYRALRPSFGGNTNSAFLYSLLPLALLWMHTLDENTMLCYLVGIIFTLLTYLLGQRGSWWMQMLLSLPLYWLAGPVMFLQVGLAVCDQWGKQRWPSALVKSLVMLAVATSWVYLCRMLWMPQFPWGTVLAGINYHRLTRFLTTAPSLQYAFLYLTLSLVLVARVLVWLSSRTQGIRLRNAQIAFGTGALVVAAFYLCPIYLYQCPHDENTHALLEQMYLIRRNDWQGIIRKAEDYNKQHLAALETPLSANAVNLALALTDQLSTRMFEFPQSGIQGLLMPNVRDNVSNVTTMEAFWHLGFVNESMRYAFDSQESIPNCRKSGRFLRRMAECNIVNGRYAVASKYIGLLKQSLFYKDWAVQAEKCLYDEARVESNPEWSRLRQLRLQNDFLYSFPEMDKMLGQLVLRNRQNHLAFNYFMAALLLEGDYRSFVANLPHQPEQGQDPFPRGYQQYVERMKQQSGTNVDVTTGASSQNK